MTAALSELNHANFSKATIITSSFTGATTSFTLSSGHGSRLPTVPFRAVLWNSTDYDDPAVAYWSGEAEIIEVTTRIDDTLTLCIRGLEGTSGITSTVGKVYKIINTPTKALLENINRREINVKAYGAVGDGTTDDSASIQSALNAGGETVTGADGTYHIHSMLTIPTGIELRDITLQAGTAGMNVVQMLSGSKFKGKIIGTGQSTVVERGIYAVDVTDLEIDAEISQVTIGIHLDISASGVLRSIIKSYIHDILGVQSSGLGDGVVLAGSKYCTGSILAKTIGSHALYLNNGSSYNDFFIDVDVCGNDAIVLYSPSPQPAVNHNSIKAKVTGLYKPGGQPLEPIGVTISHNSNYNTIELDMVGGTGTYNFIRHAGPSGGPYPTGNTITNCHLNGQCVGSACILVQNSNYVNINGNIIEGYAANYSIGVIYSGTHVEDISALIHGNTIDCLGNNCIGIYTETPCWIGDDNGIFSTGSSKRLDSSGAIPVDKLNVKLFGATGDGITDDTAAIQAAISAIPATGGEVFFPPGSYIVTATDSGFMLGNYVNVPVYRALNIDKSNLSLVGSSAILLLKGIDNPAGSEVNYVFSTAKNMTLGTISNIKISGLDFDFNPALVPGRAGTNYRSFHIVGLKGLTIDNCYFYSSGTREGSTITLQNCETVRMTNLRFKNVTQGMNLSYIKDIVGSNWQFENFSEAVDFDRVITGFELTNLTFLGTGNTQQCLEMSSAQNGRIDGVYLKDVGTAFTINYKLDPETYAKYVANTAPTNLTPSKNITISNVRGENVANGSSSVSIYLGIDRTALFEGYGDNGPCDNIVVKDVYLKTCNWVFIEDVTNLVWENVTLDTVYGPADTSFGAVTCTADATYTAADFSGKFKNVKILNCQYKGFRVSAPSELTLDNVVINGFNTTNTATYGYAIELVAMNNRKGWVFANKVDISNGSNSPVAIKYYENGVGSYHSQLFLGEESWIDIATVPTALTFSPSTLHLINDHLNVHTFGATGDGTTDDTAAIQAAITAAGGSGGTVFFPTGTYKTTAQLNLNYSNVTLRGEGKASIIKAGTATFNVLKLYGATSKIEIRDLQIQGAATDSTNGNYGIFSDSAATVPTDVSIENVYFSGPDASTGLNNGIKIHTGGLRWKISNCRFERLIGTSSGHGYGILCASQRAQILNNQFTGASGQGRHPIYLTDGSCYCLVSGNSIDYQYESGIQVHATSGMTAIEHNVISNNIINDCCHAGSAESGSIELIGKCNYNEIIGNRITDADTHGIAISDNGEAVNMTGNVVSGNYLSKIDEHGILIEGAIETVVDSNKIFDASQAVANDCCAIVLFSYPSGIVANKNRITNNVCWGTQLNSSIYLNPTAPLSTNTTVSGNVCVIGLFGGVRIGIGVVSYIVNSNVEEGGRREIVASAAPTTGTWNVGDIVWNSAPSAGGNIGWVCTNAAGSGTWESFGEAGGTRQSISGWYPTQATASETATIIRRETPDDSYTVLRVGSITGVIVKSTQARTAGTCMVEVYKNDGATGLQAILNGTDTTFKVTTQAKDADVFAAGDYLTLKFTTSADWAPATAVIDASIEIET